MLLLLLLVAALVVKALGLFKLEAKPQHLKHCKKKNAEVESANSSFSFYIFGELLNSFSFLGNAF